MEDCIFCKIVSGQIPAVKIYEDDNVLSFLDLNPVSKGHALVIPKQHSKDLFEMEEQVAEKILPVAKIVGDKLIKSLKADGLNLVQSNGKIAGQVIFHFHLHLIPRYKDDGIVGMWGAISPQKASPEDLKNLAKEINS